MRLDQLKPGEAGTICAVGGQGPLRGRLLDMGLTPGITIEVKKVAPLGDPMELWVRGYALSLRKEEAAWIQVKQEEKAIEGCADRKSKLR